MYFGNRNQNVCICTTIASAIHVFIHFNYLVQAVQSCKNVSQMSDYLLSVNCDHKKE
jgi:hypothetical protein